MLKYTGKFGTQLLLLAVVLGICLPAWAGGYQITELKADYDARTRMVAVSGTSDAESGNKITLKITHESGRIVYLNEVLLDARGEFSVSVVLKESAPYGSYLVECKGNAIAEKASAVFVHYPPSHEKEITAFRIKGVKGQIAGQQINLTLPAQTQVKSLIPLYEVSDRARVLVDGMVQENGITAQDFTAPVTYTVVAEDGSTAEYTVRVRTASSSGGAGSSGSRGSRPGGTGGVLISGSQELRPELLPDPVEDPGAQPETGVPEASMFADVPQSHWAYSYIQRLKVLKVLEGTGGNRFEPESEVTTAEFAKMMITAAGIPLSERRETFLDVDEDDWFAAYAAAALERGLVEDTGYFYPEEPLKREKMAFMLYRAIQVKGITLSQDQDYSYADADQISPDRAEAVRVLSSSGVLCGDENGAFRPKAPLTRAEAAKVTQFLIGGNGQ